jgi:hypothetical protein
VFRKDGEKMNSDNPLEALGLTVDDVEKADQEKREKGPRDRRVCVCGHGVSRHTNAHGAIYCKPARMECPCKKIQPVLETNDTRPFLRKTDGMGAQHALARGIKEAITRGKSVKWLIDMVCWNPNCGKTVTKLTPVPMTQRGTISGTATGFDVMLCDECLLNL